MGCTWVIPNPVVPPMEVRLREPLRRTLNVKEFARGIGEPSLLETRKEGGYGSEGLCR